jgi:hypothetical protein
MQTVAGNAGESSRAVAILLEFGLRMIHQRNIERRYFTLKGAWVTSTISRAVNKSRLGSPEYCLPKWFTEILNTWRPLIFYYENNLS